AKQVNMDKEDELDQFGSESSEKEKPNENIEKFNESAKESDEEFDTYEKDSINELFSKVFANDSLSYDAKIKKPYYFAGIY
ncbi:12064_t:CDS:1, partial [Gigaspora rosea]